MQLPSDIKIQLSISRCDIEEKKTYSKTKLFYLQQTRYRQTCFDSCHPQCLHGRRGTEDDNCRNMSVYIMFVVNKII